jgi:hypothetical protein
LANPGGEGIVVFASVDRQAGWVHLILANHERPETNVTITLNSGVIGGDSVGGGGRGAVLRGDFVGGGGGRRAVRLKSDANATVARVDNTHANAYTAWVGMGSPKADSQTGSLDPKVVAALHAAAALVEEPLEVQWGGLTTAEVNAKDAAEAAVTVVMPHHGVARIRLALA